MTLDDFVYKLHQGYNISKRLAELIIEEYGEKNIDWQATYSAIKSAGTAVTHIGAIETKLVYIPFHPPKGEIREREGRVVYDAKQRQLRDPDFFKWYMQNIHPYHNLCLNFDNFDAVVRLEDVYEASKYVPESREKEVFLEFYERRANAKNVLGGRRISVQEMCRVFAEKMRLPSGEY